MILTERIKKANREKPQRRINRYALVALTLAAAILCGCTGPGTVPDAVDTDSAVETATPLPTDTPEPTIARTPAPGQYMMENGVIYSAGGFTDMNNQNYTFKEGLNILPLDYTKKNFNKLLLRYTSSKALKLTVTYVVDGEDVIDTYYLEAGENITFKGLILGYLDGKTATEIKELTFDSRKGSADFTVYELSSEYVQVHNDDTCYIENDLYKVGVRLIWGGGIDYVEDKKCAITDLTNLINRHDTGRLIQQSYYGGYDSSYTPGKFNGQTWTYNPVQGGDQYGNKSRLIDLEIGDNYIYIKSQPQDWAQDNLITPSYMENKYILEGDYIRVDNRFVDYSGYPHGLSNQELPAFYTVSYLDCFWWYNGINSWTDEGLAYRDSLNFWGDSQYADSCRFHMKDDNTETWCAWTNTTDNFGIGLFVPGIDLFYAGRYKYNGSKNPKNDATNYVAPLLTIKLQSYQALEYSYLISTGSLEDIRATFKANKDFATNESLHNNYSKERETFIDYTNLDFTKKANAAAFTALNNCTVAFNSSGKALKLRAKAGGDPQVAVYMSDFPGAVTKDNYSTLSIEYMVPASNSRTDYVCDLFLCTGDKLTPDGSEQVRRELICDGEYHTLTINIDELDFWTGKLNMIRFDFFDECTSGDTLMVRSMKFEN